MIYTIGNERNYLEAICQEGGPIEKMGKATMHEQRERWHQEAWKPHDYPGGYAFKTAEDAQRRIDEAYPDRGFAVFGLLADWEQDTYPNPNGGWWHNLLVDVEIVLLEKEAAPVDPACGDCGLSYSEFAIDTTIPDLQWEAICPDSEGGGLLCANCMVKRAANLDGVIAARMVFEIVPAGNALLMELVKEAVAANGLQVMEQVSAEAAIRSAAEAEADAEFVRKMIEREITA